MDVVAHSATASPLPRRESGRALARGAAKAFSLRTAAVGASFLLQLVLARALGLEGYGEYAYAFAWAQTLAIFARFGLDNTSLRFASQYQAAGEYGLLRGLLRRSSQVSILAGLLIAGTMATAACIMRDHFTDSLFLCLCFAAVLLPITALTMVYEASLRALGRVAQGLASTVVWPLLLLLTVLLVWQLGGYSLSSSAVMLLHVLAALLALALTFGFLKRPLATHERETPPKYETREWLSVAAPLMFASAMTFLQKQSGIILSGLMLGSEQAGLFAALTRISTLVLFGLQAVNMVAAPRFSVLNATASRAEFQRYVRLCTWAGTGFALLASAVLVLFGREILGLFGEGFSAGYSALLILLLGMIVNASCGSVGFLLNMTGHQRDTLLVNATALGLNLLLSVLLIPAYGVVGAAIAAAASMAIWNAAQSWMVGKRLGLATFLGQPQPSRS